VLSMRMFDFGNVVIMEAFQGRNASAKPTRLEFAIVSKPRRRLEDCFERSDQYCVVLIRSRSDCAEAFMKAFQPLRA